MTGMMFRPSLAASTFAFQQGWIEGTSFMTLVGLGLYLSYVPFGCVLFDRIVAMLGVAVTAVFTIQLADAIGVSRPAVSLWESNDPIVRNEPTRTRLRNLSIITGAPLHWLMNDADNTLPENFGKVIKEIEAINYRLGDLSPEQIALVRNIVDSY